jgi:hypothetical protein
MGEQEMGDEEENACRVRMVDAPDGVQIPVPAGGLGLGSGLVNIRDDAEVQIHVTSNNGYYVVVNNAEPSNDEASDLFSELTVETAVTKLERLATLAFSEVPAIVFKALGLAAGVLVSVFTTSQLTKEVFIRSALQDGFPITYCLLL